MRIHEILAEIDQSRRNFLGGLLALGSTAALGKAEEPHVPWEWRPGTEGEHWAALDPKTKQTWLTRRAKLLQRSQAILAKLLGKVGEDNLKFFKNTKILVPVEVSLPDIATTDISNKTIQLDLGTFWDLTDDTIAYVIGHELGHIYLEGAIKQYQFGRGGMQTAALKRKHVEYELACDAYGAKLAYSLGYNPKKALDQFGPQGRSWRYDPKEPEYSYYPDYKMRKSNIDKTVDQLKNPPGEQPDLASSKVIAHITRGIRQLANA